ncbi:hypothetical protein EMPS_07466 [Entomortierella parvispora]|uniref:Uncharacterized protein n=1 Tax=Entomortierella parvispora TaxID=205924 RepID=A0A9P3HEZ1_9FUNG|nr:hypothetical protein EMPS_07466 [Entomortierella parvispora]
MPLHLAIISNRIDVVASLLKAGADMTLASPMTHKTPLDLAESRLSYLLSRAQEGATMESTYATPGYIDFFGHHNNSNNRSMHIPPTQSPALLYQIKGIVNLLRPYVLRQQRLQYGERQKERQKERSWDRADKYMRQHIHITEPGSLWQGEPRFGENIGEMNGYEDDNEDGMETNADVDGDIDLDQKPLGRRPCRLMDADETEEALETLLNGLSLLEANQKQQKHSLDSVSDGNLADSEQDPQGGREVEDALPDLLEQVQHVLQSIKLNEQ